MDFGLSEDQQLLESTVRGFLAERVPIERVRALRERDCPYDRDDWRALAELGVTGVLVPEAQGGSGLALLDAAIVAEALGHAVTPAPFLASAVMAPLALRAVGGREAAAWLSGIAAGELVVGVAATELFSVREGAGVRLARGRLTGKALMAIDAHGADRVLVAVDEATLAVVKADAPGVAIERLATVDATHCTSEVVLDGVAPEALWEDAADAVVRGTIRSYDVVAPNYRAGAAGQPAEVLQRQVNITVEVQIVDLVDNVILWEDRGVRAEGQFLESSETEEVGRAEALELLVQRIVDGAQSNW